jgi:hypothetical protein
MVIDCWGQCWRPIVIVGCLCSFFVVLRTGSKRGAALALLFVPAPITSKPRSSGSSNSSWLQANEQDPSKCGTQLEAALVAAKAAGEKIEVTVRSHAPVLLA